MSTESNASGLSAEPRGAQRFLRDLGTPPNLISLGRIVGIYVAMGLYLSGWKLTGLGVGLVAGLSDYLDGYLARRLKMVTAVGALLDQLGDIIMESSGILLAVLMGAWHPAFLYLYLFRNFTNISVRMAAALSGIQIPSVFFGKMGANFNYYSILLVFIALAGVIPAPYDQWAIWVSTGALVVGLACGYVSMFSYLRAYIRSY